MKREEKLDLKTGQVPRQYLAGDATVVEMDLEHRTNPGEALAAFTPETTSFPQDRQAGDAKTSRVVLEAIVLPETVPGVYTLDRVNVFSVGGRLARIREEDLSGVSGRSFEVVEEPAETPSISGLRFLD